LPGVHALFSMAMAYAVQRLEIGLLDASCCAGSSYDPGEALLFP
jgi:hypothetical protein